MRIIIILLSLSFFIQFTLSSELKLLSATPNRFGNKQFPVNLYEINEGSKLQFLKKIISVPKYLDYIQPFYSENILVVVDRCSKGEICYKVLHFDNLSMSEYALKYDYSEYGPSRPFFACLQEGKKYICAKLYGIGINDSSKLKIKIIGINLESGEQTDLMEDIYQYLIFNGSYGSLNHAVILPELFINDDGLLKVQRNVDSFTVPIKSVSIPIQKNKFHYVWINNNYEIILTDSAEQETKFSGFGKKLVRLYDKSNGEWKKIEFKGNRTQFYAFKYWVAGQIQSTNSAIGIPGKESRNQIVIDDTRVYDIENRSRDFGIYAPGIIFAYNVLTDEKYEYETGQADSDILLIEDDVVYWRKYDEIYKSKLSDNTFVDHQLLCKDENVPTIHWAFMGSE